MIPWEDDFDILSKKQTALAIGSLLGDGRLECRSKQNTARLRIHHAESQKDYLLWKYRMLKSIVSSPPKRHEYIDGRYHSPVVSWYFHTKTLGGFSKLYTLFYHEGKKVIPNNIDELLDPFVLAVWVMDDGCFFKQALILNTQSFTITEQQLLRAALKTRFHVAAGIQKDRKNFRLYFSIVETKKIRMILQSFLFVSKFIPVETDSRYNTEMR